MKNIYLLTIIFPLLCISVSGQKNPSTIEGKKTVKVNSVATSTPETTNNEISKESTIENFITPFPDRPLRIVAKPRAGYPDQSHGSICIQGTVILRITFLSTGEIGNIAIIKGLPLGLVDKAIEAAKRIQFQPAIKDGRFVSVTKQIEYSFSIY